MCWQEHFSALGCHRPLRGGPFHRVALHFLWISRIWKAPDEKIAGTDRFALRNPRPSVVVSLSARMLEFNVDPSQREV